MKQQEQKGFNPIWFLVIALVFGFAFGYYTNSSYNSTNMSTGKAVALETKATSCDADSNCEMLGGTVEGSFKARNLDVVEGIRTNSANVAGNIQANALTATNTTTLTLRAVDGLITQAINSYSLRSQSISSTYGSITRIYATNIETDTIRTNTFRTMGLIGTGNGYACVNASGSFFRSQTPCV